MTTTSLLEQEMTEDLLLRLLRQEKARDCATAAALSCRFDLPYPSVCAVLLRLHKKGLATEIRVPASVSTPIGIQES